MAVKVEINQCGSCPFREVGTNPEASDCRSCETTWEGKLRQEGLKLKRDVIPLSKVSQPRIVARIG